MVPQAGAPDPESQDFTTFFETHIAPELAHIAWRRRLVVASNMLARLFLVTGLVAFLVAAGSETTPVHDAAERLGIAGPLFADIDLVGLAGFAMMVGGGVAIGVLKRKARDPKKDAALESICAFLGMDYERRAGDFPVEAFREAHVVPYYNRKRVRNRIKGTSAGVPFSLCEARLLRKRRLRDGQFKSVFQGVLVSFELPGEYAGRVMVTSDKAWPSNALQALGMEGQRVALEDPRFESHYAAYADDQTAARVVLTPLFMERMTALGESLGSTHGLRILFEGVHMRLALPTGAGPSGLLRGLRMRERALAQFRGLALLQTVMGALDPGEGGP